MKRYGILFLLCAAYVAGMVWLFSSDFGQQNNFLFTDPPSTSNVSTSLPATDSHSQESPFHGLQARQEAQSPEGAE